MLQKKVIAFRNARNWKQFHNPKDVALSLVLEAGEVLEHFQWKSPKEVSAHIKKHKAEIADELADVLYWVALMAFDLKIDLSKAVDTKLKKTGLKYPIRKAKGNATKYTKL